MRKACVNESLIIKLNDVIFFRINITTSFSKWQVNIKTTGCLSQIASQA